MRIYFPISLHRIGIKGKQSVALKEIAHYGTRVLQEEYLLEVVKVNILGYIIRIIVKWN